MKKTVLALFCCFLLSGCYATVTQMDIDRGNFECRQFQGSQLDYIKIDMYMLSYYHCMNGWEKSF